MNRQRAVRVPIEQLEKFTSRARRILRLPEGSFAICLVTNAEIARWNRAYRRKAGPTDVLSFPAEDQHARRTQRKTVRRESPLANSGAARRYLGDIAIAPAVARRNARRFGRTFSEEMRILILHGILHLMGYDHETDSGQMDRREQRLRRELGIAPR